MQLALFPPDLGLGQAVRSFAFVAVPQTEISMREIAPDKCPLFLKHLLMAAQPSTERGLAAVLTSQTA